MSDEKKDEFATVKAGLVMIKKELEEKTGKVSSKPSKNTLGQDDFLKKLKGKKKQRDELGVDIYELNRSSKYNQEIDTEQVLEIVKEKLWIENKNIRLINVAIVAYGVIGDYKRAEIEYKKAINVDPKNEDIHYNMAEIYLKQGELALSLEKLTPLIKIGKDYEAIYLGALVLFMQGQKEKAGTLVANALKTDMEFERVHKNFAFLSLLRENFDKAEEILNTLIQNTPSNVMARLVMAYIKIYKKDYEGYKEEMGVVSHLIKDPQAYEMKYIYLSRMYYFERQNMYDKAEKELSNIMTDTRSDLLNFYEKNRYDIFCKKDAIAYEVLKEAALKNINFLPLILLVFKAAYTLKKGEDFNKILSLLVKMEPEQKITLNIGNENIKVKLKDLIKTISEYKKNSIPVDMNIDIEPFNDFCIYLLYANYGICSMKK